MPVRPLLRTMRTRGRGVSALISGVVMGLSCAALVDLVPRLEAQTTSPLIVRADTGRVGVATTPTTRFEVANNGAFRLGNAYVSGGANFANFASNAWYDGTSWQIPNSTLRSGLLQFSSTDPRVLTFYQSATAGASDWAPRLTVASTGNVGIGTATPSSALHVVSPTDFATLLISSGSTTRRAALGTNQGGNAAFFEVSQNPAVNTATWQFGIFGDNRFFFGHPGEFEKLTILPDGSVGIGVMPQTALHVNGTITASVKNFQIAHPVEPATKVIQHSSLEGPEIAVFYRGEGQLKNGETEVALPSYFEALTRKNQRTVQITAIGGWSPLYVMGAVESGRFVVRTSPDGDQGQRFYWEVKAVRADVPALEVEKVRDARVR